jgi:poly(3-hydroxybutyrate) depolymerase
MQRETGEDAILVRSVAMTDCWDTSGNSPDLALFDELIAESTNNYCVDETRIFAVGYSSGSWLINQLTCVRDTIRAAGTVAGGMPGGGNNCEGRAAHMFIHDLQDEDNEIEGSERARDRLLEANQCDVAQDPEPQEPAPCVRYQGCEPGYPVVWCPTDGEGHGRQDNYASAAFWDFFQEF